MKQQCRFCRSSDGPLTEINMGGYAHAGCHDEFIRRANMDICTVCSEPLLDNRARYAQQNHPGCRESDCAGYPGR